MRFHTGGNPSEIKDTKDILKTKYFIDGKYVVYHEEVKVEKVHGKDFYQNFKIRRTNLRWIELPPLGHLE
jgi:hypothetical protein